MGSKDIYKDAEKADDKRGLEPHFDTIQLLRKKGYSWRDVAAFFVERGVSTDHTKVYRQYKKLKTMNTYKNPSVEEYVNALKNIQLNEQQRDMLKAHYNSHQVTITYTELAHAAGYDDYSAANSQYGKLAHILGDAAGYEFRESRVRKGELFYGSAVGYEKESSGEEFELVMHPELIKAITKLELFED